MPPPHPQQKKKKKKRKKKKIFFLDLDSLKNEFTYTSQSSLVCVCVYKNSLSGFFVQENFTDSSRRPSPHASYFGYLFSLTLSVTFLYKTNTYPMAMLRTS